MSVICNYLKQKFHKTILSSILATYSLPALVHMVSVLRKTGGVIPSTAWLPCYQWTGSPGLATFIAGSQLCQGLCLLLIPADLWLLSITHKASNCPLPGSPLQSRESLAHRVLVPAAQPGEALRMAWVC